MGYAERQQQWLYELKYDDLPEQHRKLADIIGVEATIQLCEALGGGQWYIPGMQVLYTAARAKRIRREYNGYNVHELAEKYKVTTRSVYAITEGRKD